MPENDSKPDGTSDQENSNPIKLKEVDPVAVYVAVFNSHSTGVQNRLQAQQQAFQYLVGVLTAASAATVALVAAKDLHFDLNLVPRLALALPIVVAPLAFIFFDNELMIFETGHHASRTLRKLSDMIGDDILFTGGPPLSTRHVISRLIHPLLSVGRWLLFVVPCLGPTVYAAVTGWNTWLWNWPYNVFFLADTVVSLALLAAVVAASIEQIKWRWPGSPLGRRLRKGSA
jgi:hypothetical protein